MEAKIETVLLYKQELSQLSKCDLQTMAKYLKVDVHANLDDLMWLMALSMGNLLEGTMTTQQERAVRERLSSEGYSGEPIDAFKGKIQEITAKLQPSIL